MEPPKDYAERRTTSKPKRFAPLALWALVAFLIFLIFSVAGCGSSVNRPDPIYSIPGEMVRDAMNRCFGRQDISYFTMWENEADILVCNDGTLFTGGVWTLVRNNESGYDL